MMSLRARVLLLTVTLLWMGGVLVLVPESARAWAVATGWLRTTAPPVVLAVLWHLAAWSLGGALLSMLPPAWQRPGPTGGLVALGIGWVVLQLLATLVGAAGLFVPAAPWVLLVLALFTLPRARAPVPWEPADLGPLALGLPFVLLALVFVGEPPIGPDELQYQIRLPEILLRTHALPADPDEPVTAYAGGVHVLYALAMGIGGTAAARPLALGFTLLGLLAGLRLARSLAGAAGAWAFVPIATGAVSYLRFGSQAGADAPQGFVVALLAVLVLDVRPPATAATDDGGPDPPFSPPVGLLGALSGLAFAMKFAAPLFLAPLWFVWWARGGRRLLLPLVGAALLPLVLVTPWLVRNAVCCGHPLFPLVGMAMPAGLQVPFDYTQQYGPGPGWRAGIRFPWDLFVLGREFDGRHFLGRLNFWPVLVAPLVLWSAATGRLSRGLFLASVAAFWLWASSLQRVVYLLPLWPLIAAIAGASLAFGWGVLGPALRGVAAAAGLTVLLAVEIVECAALLPDAVARAEVAAGRVPWDSWVEGHVKGGRALHWVRDHVPAEQRVAWFGAWPIWGLPHAFLWSGSEHLVPLRLAMLRAGNIPAVRAELDRRGVRFIVHERFNFHRSHYPELSDGELQQTFHVPLALAESFLVDQAFLRFSDGPVEVWELKVTSPP
jgi:hypothetical protein